jgi:hypothetical protein
VSRDGEKYHFQKGKGINIIFRPNYKPLHAGEQKYNVLRGGGGGVGGGLFIGLMYMVDSETNCKM